GHRKIPLGPDRRHGAQPGRRKSRDRRGDGRVPNNRFREPGVGLVTAYRLATRSGCEILPTDALGVALASGCGWASSQQERLWPWPINQRFTSFLSGNGIHVTYAMSS